MREEKLLLDGLAKIEKEVTSSIVAVFLFCSTSHDEGGNGEEQSAATKEQITSSSSPVNGAEWLELFVREMTAASDVNDARVRASKALEALEKSIYACVSAEAAKNFQQGKVVDIIGGRA